MEGISNIIIVGIIIWVIFAWASWSDKKQIKIREQVLEDFQKQHDLQGELDKQKKKLKMKIYETREDLEKDDDFKKPNLIGSFSNFLWSYRCPECNKGHFRERRGKYGEFLGCSNYPNCKNTKNMEKAEKEYKSIIQTQILTDINKAYN